jgi:hypothetical protein
MVQLLKKLEKYQKLPMKKKKKILALMTESVSSLMEILKETSSFIVLIEAWLEKCGWFLGSSPSIKKDEVMAVPLDIEFIIKLKETER